MKKIKACLAALVVVLGIGTFAYADNTLQTGHLISTVQYDGVGKNLYFRSQEGKWISGNCQSTYVWVKPGVEGQKEILSLGLAAKMAGKKVWFYGSCGSDPNYFEAHYIVSSSGQSLETIVRSDCLSSRSYAPSSKQPPAPPTRTVVSF